MLWIQNRTWQPEGEEKLGQRLDSIASEFPSKAKILWFYEVSTNRSLQPNKSSIANFSYPKNIVGKGTADPHAGWLIPKGHRPSVNRYLLFVTLLCEWRWKCLISWKTCLCVMYALACKWTVRADHLQRELSFPGNVNEHPMLLVTCLSAPESSPQGLTQVSSLFFLVPLLKDAAVIPVIGDCAGWAVLSGVLPGRHLISY